MTKELANGDLFSLLPLKVFYKPITDRPQIQIEHKPLIA